MSCIKVIFSLKSSFNHSLTTKIGKIIVDLSEEDFNSKFYSRGLKETQTFNT